MAKELPLARQCVEIPGLCNFILNYTVTEIVGKRREDGPKWR